MPDVLGHYIAPLLNTTFHFRDISVDPGKVRTVFHCYCGRQGADVTWHADGEAGRR